MFTKGSVNCVKLVPYALLVIAAGAQPCQVNSIIPTCNRLHQIVLAMDQTVNPCDDFFAYACNNHELHPNHHPQELANNQVNLNLITVMESLYPQPLPEANPNHNIFDKTYIYYKSCVNERDTNLLRYFDLIKPGKDLEWPLLEELQAYRRGETNFVVNEWPAGQFDVFALLGQLQSYGLRNVLVYQKTLGEDSALIIERAHIKKHYSLSESALIDILMGWGLPVQTAFYYANNIMDTQENWHKLYQNYRFQPQHESISYPDLKRHFPYLSVYLENMFLYKFPDNYRIELYNTRYFEFLLTKQWSAEEAQDLCNYLMLTFLIHLQTDGAHHYSKLDCIKDIRSKLDMPVSLLYYQYVYKPDELFYNREIYAFFNKTRQYVMDTLLENHLILPTTLLQELLANVSSVSLNIGNLPRNLRMTQVEKFFRNIPALELHNYYQNHLHLLRHRVLKTLLPFNKQTYTMIQSNKRGRASVPFYNPRIRQVVLPFGMFQPPLYHYTYDPIFKWSILGFDLAFGITFSAINNALKLMESHQMDYCIQQLGSRAARGDNYAALVSVNVAYKAYVNEQRIRLQPEFSDISWKKLFFLNIFQRWCRRLDSEWMYEHSRIFQNVMKMESFEEAFQCPVHHNEKCHLL